MPQKEKENRSAFRDQAIQHYLFFYKGGRSLSLEERAQQICGIVDFWKGTCGGQEESAELKDQLAADSDSWQELGRASGRNNAALLTAFHDVVAVIRYWSTSGITSCLPAAKWQELASKVEIPVEPPVMGSAILAYCVAPRGVWRTCIKEGQKLFSESTRHRVLRLSCGDLVQYARGDEWLGRFLYRSDSGGSMEKLSNIFLTSILPDFYVAALKIRAQYADYLSRRPRIRQRIRQLESSTNGCQERHSELVEAVTKDIRYMREARDDAIGKNITILRAWWNGRFSDFGIRTGKDELIRGLVSEFERCKQTVDRNLRDAEQTFFRPVPNPFPYFNLLFDGIEDSKIRARARRLINSYRENERPIWDCNRCPEMTDHGLQHAENVCRLVSKILCAFPEVTSRLSDEEKFLLLISTFLHDVGMKGPSELSAEADVDSDTIRRKHAVYTAQRLRSPEDSHLFGFQSEQEIAIVGEVCIFHSGKTALTPDAKKALGEKAIYDDYAARSRPYKFPDTDRPETSVRVRFLAALLSLADACDVHWSRVGSPEEVRYRLDVLARRIKESNCVIKDAPGTPSALRAEQDVIRLGRQAEHYRKDLSVREVEVRPPQIWLKRVPGSERADFEKALKQIREELERCGQVLAANGIEVTSVEEYKPPE